MTITMTFLLTKQAYFTLILHASLDPWNLIIIKIWVLLRTIFYDISQCTFFLRRFSSVRVGEIYVMQWLLLSLPVWITEENNYCYCLFCSSLSFCLWVFLQSSILSKWKYVIFRYCSSVVILKKKPTQKTTKN